MDELRQKANCAVSVLQRFLEEIALGERTPARQIDIEAAMVQLKMIKIAIGVPRGWSTALGRCVDMSRAWD